jgi:hypothetical protein
MKIYFIIDSIQTTILFVLMIKLATKLYLYRKNTEHANILILIPITGISQTTVSSFGIALFEKATYIIVQKTITNFYVITEITVLMYIYYKYIKNKSATTSSLLLFITALCAYLNYGFLFDCRVDFWVFFSIAEAILLVGMCLSVYLDLIFDDKITDIHKSYVFYFNTAVFILFSTTLPVYLFDAIIQDNLRIYFLHYSAINSFSYMLFYGMLIKSINLWEKTQV